MEASIENARQNIEPDFSMRSSLNMPLQSNSSQIDFINASSNVNSKQNRGISGDFEDVHNEENKA